MLIGTLMIHLCSDKPTCRILTLFEFEKEGCGRVWCVRRVGFVLFLGGWTPIHIAVLHGEDEDKPWEFGSDPFVFFLIGFT